MSEAQYPEDEFDRIGKRLPQGAHRPGQPWWHGFLPFVIAVIVAPLLAWVMLLLINSHPADTSTADVSSKASQPANQSVSSEATQTPHESEAGDESPATPESPSTSESPTTPETTGTSADSPNAAPQETEGGSVDKSSSVEVFNASGINGLAAGVKAKIVAKGYATVTASNFTGTKPKQNTIYYSANHEAQAKEIQQVLQIDMLVQQQGISGVQIVLVEKL